MKVETIGILGYGAWGTALSIVLAERVRRIVVWDHDQANLIHCIRQRENVKYLPGVQIPDNLVAACDPATVVEQAPIVVIAVRSAVFRKVVTQLPERATFFISATKGIEPDTGMTMSAILEKVHPQATIACLSGPTIAQEIARRIPSAAVAAAKDLETARCVQQLFHRQYFRIYTSDDLIGVELGGALKNVAAIAAGICDGIGLGTNSKAALVTRALAEMRRLGTAYGAKPETFSGLSGLGDLIVTCFSPLSRNRTFGERLGKGEPPQQIQQAMLSVVEGIPTAKAAYRLARQMGVSTPIVDQVYSVLYEGKPVDVAIYELLQREAKPED